MSVELASAGSACGTVAFSPGPPQADNKLNRATENRLMRIVMVLVSLVVWAQARCFNYKPFAHLLLSKSLLSGPVRAARQIGSIFAPLRKMAIADNRIMANKGDRSSPPKGGTILRNGRNTGSVSVSMIAVAGL